MHKEERISVLYVDLDPDYWTNRESIEMYRNRQSWVEEELSKKYHVNMDYNMIFFDKRRIKEYDLLLTHVQFLRQGYGIQYDSGIRELKDIHKRFYWVPIVVFTGASKKDLNDETLTEAGAMYIIRKSSEYCNQAELDKITSCIEDLVERVVKPRIAERKAEYDRRHKEYLDSLGIKNNR